MGDRAKRVLFVNSEMFPYMPESYMANIGRYLPQGIQEKGHDIRSFMPKYGCINERKNQLHEVIRLSGMNISIKDIIRPLIIKVASISAVRLQVYFIDNEDYFKRKGIDCDSKGKFYADNAERAIFYAHSVLETVKKLRWEPDIIHCNGWISQLLPLYLKKVYKDDPIFSNSKVIMSYYADTPTEAFDPNFANIALIEGLCKEDTTILKEATGLSLAKCAANYADGVIFGASNIDENIVKYCQQLQLPILPFNAEELENGSYINTYNNYYEQF